jgi:2-iminobutanoate/2-iminopropanoate deaminase
MTRQTTSLTGLGLAGVGVKDPIATAARIGDLWCTSSIPGIDPATGNLPEGVEAQFAQAFANAEALLKTAGLSRDEIGLLTVVIPDASGRPHINTPWLAMFPTDDRPARKTTHAPLPPGQLVQLQLFAVAGGRRQPIDIPGIEHRDPLPVGVRMGNLLFSSVLGGDVPGSDQRPQGDAQIAQLFANMGSLVEHGGGKINDIALVWMYVANFGSNKAFIEEQWLGMFPRDGDRSARKTFPYQLGGQTLIQAQLIAVLGGQRANYEVAGIGHSDPVPLAMTKGGYLFTSGITGTDPATGKMAQGADAQTIQALENLGSVCGQAGATLDDIVQVTVLIAGEEHRAAVHAAWRQLFPNPGDQPALHVMNLGLPGRETLTQVHAIGVLPA